MTRGGGPEFPDVDPRFDVEARHRFGPFWQLQVIDTVSGTAIPVSGGSFLTGYGSVRRAAKYSSRLWLSRTARLGHRSVR